MNTSECSFKMNIFLIFTGILSLHVAFSQVPEDFYKTVFGKIRKKMVHQMFFACKETNKNFQEVSVKMTNKNPPFTIEVKVNYTREFCHLKLKFCPTRYCLTDDVFFSREPMISYKGYLRVIGFKYAFLPIINEKCRGPNEYPVRCMNHCQKCEHRFGECVETKQCIPGCDCFQGFWRKAGKCVPEFQCFVNYPVNKEGEISENVPKNPVCPAKFQNIYQRFQMLIPSTGSKKAPMCPLDQQDVSDHSPEAFEPIKGHKYEDKDLDKKGLYKLQITLADAAGVDFQDADIEEDSDQEGLGAGFGPLPNTEDVEILPVISVPI